MFFTLCKGRMKYLNDLSEHEYWCMGSGGGVLRAHSLIAFGACYSTRVPFLNLDLVISFFEWNLSCFSLS